MDGFMVNVHNLFGDGDKTAKAIQTVLDKEIEGIELTEDNVLKLHTVDSNGVYLLKLWDDGQSCCEDRYMRTDDTLTDFIGAKLLEIELRDAPSMPHEWGDHDVQFLVLVTDKGNITFSNHVEHNGYYGGFSIHASSEF